MTRLGSAPAALLISALACGIGFATPAAAKVTKLEISSQESYGTFKPGEYVWWQGRISGELAPTEKIPDLDKAAKNAHGMVEYSAKISLISRRTRRAATVRCWSISPTAAGSMRKRCTTARATSRSNPAPPRSAPASCRITALPSPRCNGSSARARICRLSPTLPARSISSRASALPSCGTRPTSSGTRRPIPPARPIRCTARSSMRSPPASRSRAAT